MRAPKITIITATYNAAATLEQSIQSVVQQTYPNIEYIIIDGQSTDGTVDIIRKYDSKITYWVSEPDRGIYDALNKGITHATGEYIYVLGADDCICSAETIKKIVKVLHMDDTDILSAAVWMVDEKSGFQWLESGEKVERADYDFSMVPHQGMFVRRKLLFENLFDLSYRIAADYLFFMNCYHNESVKIKYIDLPVAFYSTGGISSVDADMLLVEENNRVRRNFGLPLEQISANVWKKTLKDFLKAIHVFEFARCVFNRYIRRTWVLHRCGWNGCRWCRR